MENASVVDWLVAGCAVFGAASGAWNLWRAGWGSRPRFRIEAEYLEGAKFRLRNTGRQRNVICKPWVSGGATDLPDVFELKHGQAQPFVLRLWPRDEFPPSLTLEIERGPFLTVDLPYSPEAHQAAKEPRQRP